ncbi:ABC transporter permease [Clostridium sp. YIM B02505]|uniref:ABC transporter permease n=1 Tax=Clostridium yunnanense TaxID=2800325 RepID=A0ABS1ER44_9CLOT|nr:ABC transporter permease [Clostridium yunnanense]MBK1811868.1 ABC transporter permease [Clostridium yunnanense]
MDFIENFRMSLDSIKANKLRSFLTMLGIIIGISSVIAILSLGNGGKASITGELEKIGSSTVELKVSGQQITKSDYFNVNDVKAIKDKSENVKYISPLIQKSGTVRVSDKSKRAVVYGGNTDFSYIQNYEFLFGRFFNEREMEAGKNVAVVDEITAEYLFGYKDITGESILIGRNNSPKKVTVVGVTKSSELMVGFAQDQIPAFIAMPVATIENIYDLSDNFDSMYVLAETKDKVDTATSDSINILEARHNNKGKEVYTGEKLMKQVEQVNKVIDIFTSFIGAVAAISLLVGGIGVMNIMLVSVTERTREIGIRKAIGATTNLILIQFLTESVIISLIGGVVGMVIGILGAFAIGRLANVTPILYIKHIFLVILFSMSVGIFFGIYPARKAAKLDPIDALRYE